jgi:hypothetical protein
MCCDDAELPPAVAAMLAGYRARHAGHPLDWGGDMPGTDRAQAYARWLGMRMLMALFMGKAGDWPAAVRDCLPDPLPHGLTVATLDPDGVALQAGPRPYALPGRRVEAAVLLDSRLGEAATVEVGGTPVRVEAGGVELVEVTGPGPVRIGVVSAEVGEPVAAGRVRLRAGAPSRWSVTDDHGGAWFPDGVQPRFDIADRPMCHGDDLEIEVPAVPLTIRCRRGMEFGTVETTVTPAAGEVTDVELAPERLYDAAARGWYGGDLHVHMNYSGDQVRAPAEAAAMQLGEGLHLMNLVAGNIASTLVYDREAFEATAGEDLPWSTAERVARFSVEYRNDLLGHFHALGPARPPVRYHSGHVTPDWPPNATACEDLRDAGATIGYTHPVMAPLPDGTPAGAFQMPRSMDARELVADAALGLVDSVDLLGPNDAEGSATLYHHLLNCGLRLAATVGTDVWLSWSRGPLLSNPPGYARVYADLRGAPLSVPAFADAIRAGRTLATNGPWLAIDVAGRGPGDEIAAASGDTLDVTVRVEGLGVEQVELLGPDGVLATGEQGLQATVTVDSSMWLCAVARGPRHASVPAAGVFAHTSPVYVTTGGQPVRRAASARWLLEWLDRLEAMLGEHGRFDDDAQRAEVLDVVERGRSYYLAQLS